MEMQHLYSFHTLYDCTGLLLCSSGHFIDKTTEHVQPFDGDLAIIHLPAMTIARRNCRTLFQASSPNCSLIAGTYAGDTWLNLDIEKVYMGQMCVIQHAIRQVISTGLLLSIETARAHVAAVRM